MTTEVRVHVDLNYLWNAIAESQDFKSEKVTGRVTLTAPILLAGIFIAWKRMT
jgi:hypothetical protein